MRRERHTLHPSILGSFGFALRGLIHSLRTERNMRIHLVVGVSVLIISTGLGLVPWEWVAVIMAISLVLSAELFNTALEATVDLASPRLHPLAAVAKNAAAAAVFVMATNAVLVAWFVLWPKVRALLE